MPDVQYFPKSQILEADGFYSAVVEHPKGNSEKFAFVLENRLNAIKMYYFLDRETVKEVITTLVDSIGTDA